MVVDGSSEGQEGVSVRAPLMDFPAVFMYRSRKNPYPDGLLDL